MFLAAEAQSGLRDTTSKAGYTEEESSQLALFSWLKQKVAETQTYIPRFMRRTDAPSEHERSTLAGRIADLHSRYRERIEFSKRGEQAVKTIKFHVSHLSTDRDNSHDWRRIFETIEETVPTYLQPTDVRLRELLIRHLNAIPESVDVVPQGQEVLNAIDQFLATRPEVESLESAGQENSPEVLIARKKLKDKKIVIIGGDARPYAKEALRAAFGLKEVIWIATREHQSSDAFRPYIRTPGVAVVFLAIRWASHSFGVVRDYCKEANVPFVRLPGGYGPAQVAHQILEQAPDLPDLDE